MHNKLGFSLDSEILYTIIEFLGIIIKITNNLKYINHWYNNHF